MATDNPFAGLNFNPDNLKTAKDQSAEIQNQMLAAQKMLNSIEAEGTAGLENYNVKVRLNGRHEAVKVTIDQQLLTQPAEVLCDLVASAITDASHKTEIAIQQQMMGLFKNMKIPG